MENRIGFLVIIVVHNVAKLPDLLHAWQKIGVPGATILRSTGAYRMTTWLSRVGLGGLERLLDSEDSGQRTLLAGIEDPDLLARAIAEAERALGNFDEPHSGLLLVVPVAQVKGLHKTRRRETPTPLPAAVQPDWVVRRDTPIEKVLPMLLREAATVLRETPSCSAFPASRWPPSPRPTAGSWASSTCTPWPTTSFSASCPRSFSGTLPTWKR